MRIGDRRKKYYICIVRTISEDENKAETKRRVFALPSNVTY